MDQDTLFSMIRMASEKKTQIELLQAELKDLNQQIYEETTFKEGTKTAHLDAGDIVATVSKKETYDWNQSALNKARAIMGDEKFLNIFTFQWKPKSKKDLDGFLSFAPEAEKKPVMDALTIKNSYSVAYKAAENV